MNAAYQSIRPQIDPQTFARHKGLMAREESVFAAGPAIHLPRPGSLPQAPAPHPVPTGRQLPRPGSLPPHVPSTGQPPPLPGQSTPRPSPIQLPPSWHPASLPRPGTLAQHPTAAPAVDGTVFNARLLGQVTQLLNETHKQVDAQTPPGHQLSTGELRGLFGTISRTASQLQQMGAEAAKRPEVSLDSMAQIQGAVQDLFTAGNLYMSMAGGQAQYEYNAYLNQLRNAMALAQQNYQAVAQNSQRRATLQGDTPADRDRLSQSFGPIPLPPAQIGFGLPPGQGFAPQGLPLGTGQGMSPQLPPRTNLQPELPFFPRLPASRYTVKPTPPPVREPENPNQLRLPLPGT